MSDIVKRLRSRSPYLDGSSAERTMEAAAAEIERLHQLLNAVRIQMKNQDRRESEVPLYNAICRALEPKP